MIIELNRSGHSDQQHSALNGDTLRVEIVRSKTRRSTVTLKYAEHGGFILAAPAATPESWIHEFLAGRRDWMEKARRKALKHREKLAIAPGSVITTDFHKLYIEADVALKYPQYKVLKKAGEQTSVFRLAPDFFTAGNLTRLYQNLEKYLLAQMMKQGNAALISRAEFFAKEHGIKVREIFVRVQKSRLGYCTHDDRIMLNARLLFAPQKIRDYVIHHELAHTRHRNHSKQYWAYLETIFPGAKAVDKLLRDSSVYAMRVDR